MTNLDAHWFLRRDGTWSVRVFSRGISPDGAVIDTHRKGLREAQIAAAQHVADVVRIAAARLDERRSA